MADLAAAYGRPRRAAGCPGAFDLAGNLWEWVADRGPLATVRPDSGWQDGRDRLTRAEPSERTERPTITSLACGSRER
jgi:formylglycine-generating enzyme required for sulfatase activity